MGAMCKPLAATSLSQSPSDASWMLHLLLPEFHRQAVVAPSKLPIEERTVAESTGIDDFRNGQLCCLEQQFGMHEPVFQDEVAGRSVYEFAHLSIQLRAADGQVLGQ